MENDEQGPLPAELRKRLANEAWRIFSTDQSPMCRGILEAVAVHIYQLATLDADQRIEHMRHQRDSALARAEPAEEGYNTLRVRLNLVTEALEKALAIVRGTGAGESGADHDETNAKTHS